MSFHEVLFPLAIGFGARGGPERRTQIVMTGSGREERNSQWRDSLRRYDVGTGIRDIEDAETVAAFFEDRRGRFYGFRFRDPLDHKSCPIRQQPSPVDQQIGIGGGAASEFQLVKIYGTTVPWSRPILKPVSGSVRVSIDGVEQVLGTDFSLDTATGVLTFSAVPAVGAVIKAGYLFDVPARFDTDELDIQWSGCALASVPSIPIVEVRL